jgi:hypothetical protein
VKEGREETVRKMKKWGDSIEKIMEAPDEKYACIG